MEVKTTVLFEDLFLDAIASLQIPYIQVTTSLRPSQSTKYLLGQDSRPFRQVEFVKKANIANMDLKTLMATMAIIAMCAITAISAIKALTIVTAIRIIRFNTVTRAAGEIVAIKARSH